MVTSQLRWSPKWSLIYLHPIKLNCSYCCAITDLSALSTLNNTHLDCDATKFQTNSIQSHIYTILEYISQSSLLFFLFPPWTAFRQSLYKRQSFHLSWLITSFNRLIVRLVGVTDRENLVQFKTKPTQLVGGSFSLGNYPGASAINVMSNYCPLCEIKLD